MATSPKLLLTSLETEGFAAISEVNQALLDVENSENAITFNNLVTGNITLTETQVVDNKVIRLSAPFISSFTVTIPSTLTRTLPNGTTTSVTTQRVYIIIGTGSDTITVRMSGVGNTISIPSNKACIFLAHGNDVYALARN